MRKILLLMVGFAISLTACQKNEGLVSDAITTSSFTITIPQSGISTRAVTDASVQELRSIAVFWKSTTVTSSIVVS